MSANPFQQRGPGGRFSFSVRPESGVSLTAPPRTSPEEDSALVRRRELQARAGAVRALTAVESAAALAARTRTRFPSARYLSLRADDAACSGAEIEEILDGQGQVLASRSGAEQLSGPYREWSRGQDPDESADVLAADLGGHAGLLDGALTPAGAPRSDGFGVYAGRCRFTLDLDKTLEAAARRHAD